MSTKKQPTMKERVDVLWERIEGSKGPLEVVDIMRGEGEAFGHMQQQQYHPQYTRLILARNSEWSLFWEALKG